MDCDVANIKCFINNVFQKLNTDEHTLFWGSSKTSPGFPVSQRDFYGKSLRGNVQKACYFSTATVTADTDGRLYNRQKLFSRMFCIVLDDIGDGLGAKCSIDKLPEVLKNEYSWKIESSPGNFQYGFLLSQPIDNLNAAIEFVKIIYGAGPWDSGGAMPNKLVRLPCGVNLKDKYMTNDELWRVDYADDDDTTAAYNGEFNVFTPDELLDAVNAGVTWDDVLSGAAKKIDPRRTRGATAWREGVFRENLRGVVDDVLEWINDKELIVNESNEWIDIECPWASNHTDGMKTAGYKPLGFGDTPDIRAFHCFHGHCKDNHTSQFLNWVVTKGGPVAPIVDPIPALVSKWALDMKTNDFIDLQTEPPIKIPHAGFKAGHQEDVFWRDGKDKMVKATKYGLIVKSQGLLKLSGSVYAPGKNSIIEHLDRKYMNDWHVPDWAIRKTSDTKADWAMFTNFIHYLMPNGRDSEWFLDHLASKLQNPVYRGPCVVLTTPVQGSGRGTLGNMMGKLWGPYNMANVGLSEMITGLNGEGFNDWMKSVWVLTSEAKAGDMNFKQEAKAYDSLKNGIDPQPTSHTIKTKWGTQEACEVYSSFIICSNYRNILSIPPTDRRFYFIDCAIRAEDVEYFEKLHQWISGNWEANVWHELSIRDVSSHKGFAPVDVQREEDSKESRMISSLGGQSSIDRLATISVMFADKYCEGIIHTQTICNWVASFQVELGVSHIDRWDCVYKRLLQNSTTELKRDGKRYSFYMGSKKAFARHTLTETGYKMMEHIEDINDFEKVKALISKYDAKAFRDFVLEIFNEAEL